MLFSCTLLPHYRLHKNHWYVFTGSLRKKKPKHVPTFQNLCKTLSHTNKQKAQLCVWNTALVKRKEDARLNIRTFFRSVTQRLGWWKRAAQSLWMQLIQSCVGKAEKIAADKDKLGRTWPSLPLFWSNYLYGQLCLPFECTFCHPPLPYHFTLCKIKHKLVTLS